MRTTNEATRLVKDLSADGDSPSAEQLLPIVYQELRELAARYMRRERPGHTLQPTALVHEAYMRLVNDSEVEWKGRTHFLAIAARSIRQILVNHARARRAVKRGGGRKRVTVQGDHLGAQTEQGVDLLALHEAMEELKKLNERQCRVVELRFFGGLSVEDVADVLGVSPRTAKGDRRVARAWLKERLSR